jgi:ATP-dependent DNA ligase
LLLSRNGHRFASFADLANDIAVFIPNTRLTVLDGEIVCIDDSGKPQFRVDRGQDWERKSLMP